MDAKLRSVLLEDAAIQNWRLASYELCGGHQRNWPFLRKSLDKTAAVEGVLLADASAALRDRLDAYFGLFGQMHRLDDLEPTFVLAEITEDQTLPLWEFANWPEPARREERLIVRDVIAVLAEKTPCNTPINRNTLLMRARSHIRAVDHPVKAGVRRQFGADDTHVTGRSLPYQRYFDVEDVALEHRRFDGDMSGVIHRAVLRAADAVTVLPYDPVTDQVVLVEQFRPGAFVRGDTNPWVLEPVAGRCDGDEPVAEVARREMIEEAGLTLLSLEEIGNYYPSPGCLTEYLYSFVGLVDLSNSQSGIHGLEAENEDIRTHFLSFERAMALIATGEAQNGPLLLSLFWLSANRTRLRQSAGIA